MITTSSSFWNNYPTPIFALAPMEDVTDTVFREIILSQTCTNKLNVVFTEFCSTDGLCHPKGREKVIHRLLVNNTERQLLAEKNVKIVAQIWGTQPQKFANAVKYITSEFNFDGIDINMGCPVKKIVKQGGCSALISNPSLAKEIILASKESTHLPISIKTRTGIKTHNTVEWLGHIFECLPAAVTLHCRTQADMSEKPADWEQVSIAVQLKNKLNLNIPIIGNGDIFTLQQAQEFIAKTGANGVMIGRGIFKNPFMFSQNPNELTIEQRLELLLKHTLLFNSTWHNTKNFAILKRFFKIYTHNLTNSNILKAQLMETNNVNEVEDIISKLI